MTALTVLGIWIAAFLTICIFSFLYHDNPFYKLAEHVFVGVSAGYSMVIGYWEVLRPNLIDRLAHGEWIYVIPAVMGVLLVLRLVPGIAWISRWPLAFMVGLQAGFFIVYTMQAQILKQISATVLPLWGALPPSTLLFNWIIVAGVMCALVYFYFSVEHKGPIFGWTSRIGIYVLMISFGASFGYTVMARVSLLIGRMLFFKNEFWPAAQALFGHHG